MKTALLKNGIKEIKNSYKRFLSILLIVLLGVGFFAGLKATSPDMKKTLDTYFDDLNVMDLQVISTLGLTDDDIEAISNIDGVSEVEGSYQTDAIIETGNEETVVMVETYSENINKLELVEGRLPTAMDECVVEESFLNGTGMQIGDTIEIQIEDITNDDGEEQSVLKTSKVTIVGIVKSPLYISTDRGSTDLGSGTVEYYVYINKENIDVDLYTNIYLTVEGAKELNTTGDEYAEKIDDVQEKLEAISDERREARYNELYDNANSKIEEAQEEFDKQKEEGEEKLEKAQEEIESGKTKIEEAKAELKKNKQEANSKFAEAEQTIEEAEEEVEKNEKEYKNTKEEVEDQIAEYEETLETLKETQSQLNVAQDSLDTAKETLEQLEQQLVNADESEKDEIQTQINSVNVQIKTLEETIDTINSSVESMGVTNISGTITKIENAIKQANNQLTSAKSAIDSAKSQISESKKELQASKNSTYAEIAEAEQEISTSEAELKESEEELEESQEEFNKQIEEAENELLDAKAELKDIQKPDWYILDRDQNTGYASYVQDTDRVANLAKVFPVVFFLVAALISLNSMSRMVEEERVEIGTFKALGYSKIQIARKYIAYALLATIIGGVIGLIIGFRLLPGVIANLYGMVYELPEVVPEFNTEIALIGMCAALICTVGATIYTCAKELMQNPATLMRPKAPKPGKRVILEKIPFIWNRLNFTAKVTARNLFRYKKRFLMTIIGVFGCTSLIIAGFGLRDAISNMIPKQFGEIDKYNISISLNESKYGDDLAEAEEEIGENEEIVETLGANLQSVSIIKDDNTQSISLIVPEDVNSLDDFIELRDRKDQDDKYVLDDSGVIITEKLSNLLDIDKGDTITIENANGDRADVVVSEITENYLMHYIYMSPDLYSEVFGERFESNMIYVLTNDLTEDQEEVLGENLLGNYNFISGVTFTSASEDVFATVMDNMDMVVWILIIAAGLLALVVLYNLINSNISERTRELATIKVLGFYDKEVYSYIARETTVLTIIGILLGLVGGYFLTMYILKTCELDITMFDPSIGVLSYIWGILITVFFAAIVNIIAYFSIKKIDMIESLKSVE